MRHSCPPTLPLRGQGGAPRFLVARRWIKFNGVGLMGVFVQLGLLQAWTHFALGNYLLGTVVAVEATLLHNFGWHCLYTWRDRPAHGGGAIVMRAVRFHLANGAVSLVGNVYLMQWLVGSVGLPVLAANLISIVVCSTVNFFLGDRLVFGDAAERRSSA